MTLFAGNPRHLSEFQPPTSRKRQAHGRPLPISLCALSPLRSLLSLSLSISFPPPAQPAQTLAPKRRPARLSAADSSSCRARIGGEKPAATYVDRGCLVAAAAAAQGWTGSASRTRSRSTWRGRRRPPPGAS